MVWRCRGVPITGERGQTIGLKGIGRFEMTDRAAARRQEAVCRNNPSSVQLCVAVQFEGREGTRCMTFFNVNLVSCDARVCRCSNASCRGFHKTCPLCDTRLRLSVRYNNLHFSTLYLVISYNEGNIKFLLTLVLEVFEKTCTSHYTSFCQL